jgi:hypothetical protein
LHTEPLADAVKKTRTPELAAPAAVTFAAAAEHWVAQGYAAAKEELEQEARRICGHIERFEFEPDCAVATAVFDPNEAGFTAMLAAVRRCDSAIHVTNQLEPRWCTPGAEICLHVLLEPKTLQGQPTPKLLLRLRPLVRVTPVVGRELLKAYPFSADPGPADLESSRRQLHTLRAKWSAKASKSEDLWDARELVSNLVMQASYAGKSGGDSLVQYRALAKIIAD